MVGMGERGGFPPKESLLHLIPVRSPVNIARRAEEDVW